MCYLCDARRGVQYQRAIASSCRRAEAGGKKAVHIVSVPPYPRGTSRAGGRRPMCWVLEFSDFFHMCGTHERLGRGWLLRIIAKNILPIGCLAATKRPSGNRNGFSGNRAIIIRNECLGICDIRFEVAHALGGIYLIHDRVVSPKQNHDENGDNSKRHK